MRMLITTALVAVAILVSPRAAVRAQGNAESQPFLLAIASGPLPRGERATVIRTANATQPDLIVLAPDANAHHTLVSALQVLQAMRGRKPVTPSTDVASINYAEAVVDVPAERRSRLEAALRQATLGEGRKLAEFGNVHVVVVNPRSLK